MVCSVKISAQILGDIPEMVYSVKVSFNEDGFILPQLHPTQLKSENLIVSYNLTIETDCNYYIIHKSNVYCLVNAI